MREHQPSNLSPVIKPLQFLQKIQPHEQQHKFLRKQIKNPENRDRAVKCDKLDQIAGADPRRSKRAFSEESQKEG